MPRFSIIIPAYNLEEYLADCLASIRDQSFADYEVLVVDDGSRDRTAEVCRQLQASMPALRLLQQPNGGVSSARNLGLRHATGEYVWFIDGDDYIHPEALRIIDRLLQAVPDADYLAFRYANTRRRYQEPLDALDGAGRPPRVLGCTRREEFGEMLSRVPYAVCCLCIRRAGIGDLRFEPLCTCEDALFALRLTYRARKTALWDAAPYFYYQREDSFTYSPYTREKMADLLTFVREVFRMKGERDGWGDGALAFHNYRTDFPLLCRKALELPKREDRRWAWRELFRLLDEHVALFPNHTKWYCRLTAATHSRLLAWTFFRLRYLLRDAMLRRPRLSAIFRALRHPQA